MRAAVVRQPGATPVLEQFGDPRPGPGVSVGALVAAALNPLDVTRDAPSGRHHRRPLLASASGNIRPLTSGRREEATPALTGFT